MNPNQSNIHIVSANLGRWLGPEIPREVLQAARDYLRTKDSAVRLRSTWVNAFGEDLHLHLATFNGDFSAGQDPAVYAFDLARSAAVAALAKGVEMGLASDGRGTSPLKLTGEAQDQALDLQRLDYPFTERGAEPIFIAKALNASWGFFNRALYNLYFNPDKGSGHRIEGNDFTAIVESVADLKARKAEVCTFEFGTSDGNELLALVTDPDEWRLSAVYACRGRFGEGKFKD